MSFALYQIEDRNRNFVNFAQWFTTNKEIVFFGSHVLHSYLRQEYADDFYSGNENKKFLGPLVATVLADSDFDFKNSVGNIGDFEWDPENYHNIKDIVSQVSVVTNEGEYKRKVQWFTLRFNRSLTTENVNRIINLNILKISWVQNSFRMSSETFQDIKEKKMKFTFNNQTVKQWIHDIKEALYFEKYFDFTFVQKYELWNEIVNQMAKDPFQFLEYMIEWNATIKKFPDTKVPMFLLSSKNPKPEHLKDLKIIFHFATNPKYLWRIFWNEVSSVEKMYTYHPFPRSLNDTLKLDEKEIDIKDFFDRKTEFPTIDKLEGNLPDTCYEIQMYNQEDDRLEIDTHLEEEKNGLVFLRYKLKHVLEAACTSKEYLDPKPEDFNQQLKFYQCTIPETQFDKPERFVLNDEVYISINVFQYPFYVTQTNLNSVLTNNETKYFMVNESPLKLKFTMEKKAADLHTGALMSGHHCQEGSDKVISFISPINAQSITDVKARLLNENSKRAKK